MPDDSDAADNDLERVDALLREVTPADRELVTPPPEVWDAIVAEVGEGATDDAFAGEENVVSLDSRRRFAPALLVGAAAAAVVVIVGAIVTTTGSDDTTATTLASAELEYDAASFDELGADAAASVSLVDDDGTLRIEIDQAELPTPTGESADLELWLIQPDADGNPADLVSLGVVDPDDPGTFAIPATTDPDEFFVVDISVEPRDGDATHSGRSILRGPLAEV